MELRQLEYFLMVGRLHSITRAAEWLHTSQPNITTAIRKLEKELDVKLFDRNQKRIVLTPEGKIFFERIDAALSQIQDAILELNDYKNVQKGTINVGIPPMVSIYLFPAILYQFRNIYPGLEISIIEGGAFSIREKLEHGELDVGIFILTNSSELLDTFTIATQQILVCLPNEHPLCSHDTISIPDLRDEPLILLKEQSYHRHIITKQFERHNIKPRIIVSSNQIEAIKNLVKNGVGISFLLDTIVQKEVNIVTRPFVEPLYVDIGLAWKKEKYLSNAVRAFIDFISEYSKSSTKKGG